MSHVFLIALLAVYDIQDLASAAGILTGGAVTIAGLFGLRALLASQRTLDRLGLCMLNALHQLPGFLPNEKTRH